MNHRLNELQVKDEEVRDVELVVSVDFECLDIPVINVSAKEDLEIVEIDTE